MDAEPHKNEVSDWQHLSVNDPIREDWRRREHMSTITITTNGAVKKQHLQQAVFNLQLHLGGKWKVAGVQSLTRAIFVVAVLEIKGLFMQDCSKILKKLCVGDCIKFPCLRGNVRFKVHSLSKLVRFHPPSQFPVKAAPPTWVRRNYCYNSSRCFRMKGLI